MELHQNKSYLGIRLRFQTLYSRGERRNSKRQTIRILHCIGVAFEVLNRERISFKYDVFWSSIPGLSVKCKIIQEFKSTLKDHKKSNFTNFQDP